MGCCESKDEEKTKPSSNIIGTSGNEISQYLTSLQKTSITGEGEQEEEEEEINTTTDTGGVQHHKEQKKKEQKQVANDVFLGLINQERVSDAFREQKDKEHEDATERDKANKNNHEDNEDERAAATITTTQSNNRRESLVGPLPGESLTDSGLTPLSQLLAEPLSEPRTSNGNSNSNGTDGKQQQQQRRRRGRHKRVNTDNSVLAIAARENCIHIHGKSKRHSKSHSDEEDDDNDNDTANDCQHQWQPQNMKNHYHHRSRDRAGVLGPQLDFQKSFIVPSYPKSKEESEFLSTALLSNFIFTDLTDEERYTFIGAMQPDRVVPNTVIITQGCATGNYFYLVEYGTVQFVVDGQHVGSCTAGGTFGELSLLYNSPRAATCIAAAVGAGSEKKAEACKIWKVDRGTFRHILARSAKQKEANIADVVSKIELFQGMDPKVMNKFASVFDTFQIPSGEDIVVKGQKGNTFYIVKSGQVKVHEIGSGSTKIEDNNVIQGTGYWFGERALLTGNPRTATVTAITDVDVFACDREAFELSIGSLHDVLGHASRKRFIQSVPILSQSLLTEAELDQLASLLIVKKVARGTKLIEMGKKVGRNPSLWFIREGNVVLSSTTNSSSSSSTLETSDYFGELDVRSSDPEYVSKQTAIVETDVAVCYVLTKEDIIDVIGNISRLGKAVPFAPKLYDSAVDVDDVRRVKILGIGGFGMVWLATKADTKDAYALKMISKGKLIESGPEQVNSMIREKSIMKSIEHQFIIKLIGSFQDDENVFLLLPFNQGGELYNVIHPPKAHIFAKQKHGLDNDNYSAQFYAGCILEALGYLHAKNIVYRDLKPENAMIVNDGYCVLIDLGFAKVVTDKTFTMVGTPEYLAPEIIMSKGHNTSADYWSFGVLIYEMLVGQSPFFVEGSDQVSLFKRIVKCEFECPTTMSQEASSIIHRLLKRRVTSRLGNLYRGHIDVKEHDWFHKSLLNFDKLNERILKAPWLPEITNPLDARNFGDYTYEHREWKNAERKLLSAKEQELFNDF